MLNSPTSIEQRKSEPLCEPSPVTAVGDDRADEQRETSIRACGQLLEAAMARYATSSDLSDLGEAHRYRLEMEGLIRGRSQAHVQRLEQERGLT